MHSYSTPRAAVVVPLYQKASYIRRALQSVFAQTVKDVEVIVVDDGSTDEAPAILREIVDPRLVVHRQQRMGVSAARNRGVSLASAPWVAFLDADDEWLPEFLESTLRVAEASPGVSAAFCNLWDYPSHRPLLSKISCEGNVVTDYFAGLVENDGIGMSSSSALVSRARLQACGGFLEGVTHYEDMEAWARLAWSGEIAFCDASLAVYHSEVPDSASKRRRAAITPYPALLRTYEEWSAAGRIPERLRDSSRRYANWFLAWNVMELSHHGLQTDARRRLKGAEWRDSRDPIVWKAWLWTWLPTVALRSGRWLRARLARSARAHASARSRASGAD